jgi:hypothetical protein
MVGLCLLLLARVEVVATVLVAGVVGFITAPEAALAVQQSQNDM